MLLLQIIEEWTYKDDIWCDMPLIDAHVDLFHYRIFGVGGGSVDLVWEYNVANLVIQHMVYDSHELIRVAARGPIHVTSWEVLVDDAVRRLPEIVELINDIVNFSLIRVVICDVVLVDGFFQSAEQLSSSRASVTYP